MKACVDKGLCIGCGMCEGIEPDVFRIGDDGLAEAYTDPTDANADNVKQAVEMCPVSAITAE